MLQNVHAAIAAHSVCRKREGRRRNDLFLRRAAGQDEKSGGNGYGDEVTHHNSFLEKTSMAAPSGTRTQASKAATRTPWPRVTFSTTPAMPDTELAPSEPRLSRR